MQGLSLAMSTHGKSDPGQRVVSSGHPQLAADAAALTRLHEASARLWNFRDVSEGLEEILAASIDLLGADKGNVQLLDGERRVLQIAVQRGFAPGESGERYAPVIRLTR